MGQYTFSRFYPIFKLFGFSQTLGNFQILILESHKRYTRIRCLKWNFESSSSGTLLMMGMMGRYDNCVELRSLFREALCHVSEASFCDGKSRLIFLRISFFLFILEASLIYTKLRLFSEKLCPFPGESFNPSGPSYKFHRFRS